MIGKLLETIFVTHPLHGMLVHFPIALSFAGFIFLLLALRERSTALERAAFYCMVMTAVFSVLASFSGYRAEPVPVPNSSATLWMRGIKNLDATIDWLFANGGLGDATEVLLSGESAGGLSTFLHADRVGGRLKAGSPKLTKYRANPIVGFFQDHDNFAHSDGYAPDGSGGPNR